MLWPDFISKEVKIGDVLTSLSIFISVMVFLRSWGKDREVKRKEMAERVRNAAAKTLAKLDRWQEITLSLFQRCQPVFIETSEMLLGKYDVLNARDSLWKKINEARTEVLGKILDEEIEIAYVELYGYHPAVYNIFVNTIRRLKADDEKVFVAFIENTQQAVLSYDGHQKTYTPAMLGNDLRAVSNQMVIALKRRTNDTLKPIHGFLVDLVSQSDKAILNRASLPRVQKEINQKGSLDSTRLRPVSEEALRAQAES